MFDTSYLISLKNQGQIDCINEIQKQSLLSKEIKSLAKLRKKCIVYNYELYLNLYDRLFRHISILLLHHNYAITRETPHQTLSEICQHWQPIQDIREMIKLRHYFKKNFIKIDEYVDENIQKCLFNILSHFDENDGSDCLKLLVNT